MNFLLPCSPPCPGPQHLPCPLWERASAAPITYTHTHTHIPKVWALSQAGSHVCPHTRTLCMGPSYSVSLLTAHDSDTCVRALPCGQHTCNFTYKYMHRCFRNTFLCPSVSRWVVLWQPQFLKQSRTQKLSKGYLKDAKEVFRCTCREVLATYSWKSSWESSYPYLYTILRC